MFKFGKKNADITEQVMEEVTDEQLSQVSGGSLTHSVNLDEALDTVPNLANLGTQAVNSVSVSGVQVKAAGFSVSTPTIVPGTLLP